MHIDNACILILLVLKMMLSLTKIRQMWCSTALVGMQRLPALTFILAPPARLNVTKDPVALKQFDGKYLAPLDLPGSVHIKTNHSQSLHASRLLDREWLGSHVWSSAKGWILPWDDESRLFGQFLFHPQISLLHWWIKGDSTFKKKYPSRWDKERDLGPYWCFMRWQPGY